MLRSKITWAVYLLVAAAAPFANGAEPAAPQPIFYVPFEGSADAVIARGEPKLIGGSPKFEKGVVGQAGMTSGRYSPQWEGRGNVCLDRGTIALFYKPNHEVVQQAWGGVAGISTDIEGYWGLLQRFSMIGDMFCVELLDIGRSGERLAMESNVGRWKQGAWVHLAVVWDRNEGVIAYEGGKQINSSWGRQRWDWNLDPMTLWVGGEASVDEFCVFAECLTDAQIAQLARGAKPTGPPVPMTPPDNRRAADFARMGWTEEDLKQLPELVGNSALDWTFARIVRGTDEKRLVAQPFEGLKATCWPLSKYGVSLGRKHRRLDLTFAPDQSFDRMRIFAQRPFTGRLVREVPDVGLQTLAEVDATRPIWHRKLAEPLRYQEISLLREAGWIGEIDCYRVEPLSEAPSANLFPLGDLARLEKMPATLAGKAVLSDTPARFDNPVRATAGVAEPWKLAAPEFGGFQMISQPLAEQRAADGVLIQLVAEEVTGPTPLRVVVKEPIFTQRDWLVADTVLVPKGTGRQKFTLRLRGRPVLNTKGIELPVLVTAGKPVTWAMGRDGTSISLCLVDIEKARPSAIEDQVEFAREGYAETNEGHYTIWVLDPATWQRFYTPLKWLADYAPENRAYMQMAYRVGWRREPQPFTDPVNDTGAPEWAFWQMQAMSRSRSVLDWLIDHRQADNGEFGGLWGDDTDMVENWVGWAMSCDSDDAKIGGALRRFWDGVYRESLVRGVSATIRDNLHSYEEGIGCIAHQLLLDYGDPIVYERVMQSSGHLAQWMKTNDDGTLSFRSWMLGDPGVWDYGNFASDTTGNQLMMVPAAYLCWYNRHPEAERYISKWKLVGQVGCGIVGDAYARTLDGAARNKWYDARLAEEVAGRYVPTLNSLLVETGVPGDQRDALLKKALSSYHKGELMKSYNMDSYGWTSMVAAEHQWLAYLASGNTKYLANSYREISMFVNSEDWIYTYAQPSTDRIPLPEASIIRARMGAAPAHRGGNANWWPRHGISYTRGAEQVAALVTENTTRQLTVRLFAFTEKPHPLSVRFWQLDPGTYEMTLSLDKNDDGNGEATIETRTIEVVRGTPAIVQLPPRTGTVLALKAVKAATPTYDKPDPALTLKTTRLDYGEHLQAKVHNLGSRAVENLLVRFIDGRSGRVIGERRVKHIDAATDFEPKTTMIEYQNVNSIAHGSIILELDPNHEIDDLNRFNNRIVFEY